MGQTDPASRDWAKTKTEHTRHETDAATARGCGGTTIPHPNDEQNVNERCQTACKPGSVPASEPDPEYGIRLRSGGRPFLWDACCQAPRATDPDDEPETAHMPSLFGLAPGGACRAASVTVRAVRSYRTVSPLPARTPAVSSLWRYPWGRPRRVLPGTVFPWSPDFPPKSKLFSGRPAVWPALDAPEPLGVQGHSAATARRRSSVSASRMPSNRAGRYRR